MTFSPIQFVVSSFWYKKYTWHHFDDGLVLRTCAIVPDELLQTHSAY